MTDQPCFNCEDKPEPEGDSWLDKPPLCDECAPDEEETGPHTISIWGDNDFTETESDVYPTSHTEIDRWMGHAGKKPFAPWADRDHPDADPSDDARWKWGIEDNHRPFEKAKMGAVDPQVDGLAFIQQKEDPYIYVDGDDVRCPETGDIHPGFLAILSHLGETYADVSQSGAGVHAVYRGELPEDEVQTAIQLDEDPWGANEELPELEIYGTKRVLVMTGDHITGTPETAYEWDDDVVRAISESVGLVGGDTEDDERPHPAEAREDYDFADYEPSAYTAEESSGDARDVIAAVDRLHPKDVAASTIVHEWNDGATTSDNARAFVPTWGKGANGTANIVTDRVWQDTGGGGYGGPAVMAAIDASIMSPRTANPSNLTGSEWWEAVEHLRDLGFDIPEYDPDEDSGRAHDRDYVDRVFLPSRDETGRHIGWNVYDDADANLTQQEVYDRTTSTIDRAMEQGGAHLIDGIMGCGKTYSSFAAAAERDEPLLYCSAREELYEQGREYAIENGYSESDTYILPSMFRDCPAAAGDHGESLQNRLRSLRSLGVQPKTMHSMLDLPCEEGDAECPYHAKMQFDPDNYDVLIGHYSHAHLPQVASGRHVIVDENPSDAYFETIEGNELIQTVNRFLSFEKSPPFEDWEDLLAGRHDPDRVAEAKDWFEGWAAQEEWEADERNAVRYEVEGYHALTPHAVYGIVTGEPVAEGSPFNRTAVNGRNPIVFRAADEDAGYRVTINTPPSNALNYARSIIGLDGTPALLSPESDDSGALGRAPEWNLALNTRFSIKRVLTDSERETFIKDTQGIHIIQTTEAVKPYSSAEYHNRDRDFALIEGAVEEYRHEPTVFSTKGVREEYEEHEDELPCNVRGWDHFGNLRGSDEYASERLGIILGSTHYGDEYLHEKAALLGRGIEPDGKGAERRYGSEVGDAIFESMREATIAQAALRFGRDGNGARVLVHTSATPEWLPMSDEGRVVTTWDDAQRDALDLLADGWEGTAAEMADHLTVGIRQTRNILNGLADRNVAERDRDPEDGRRYVWTADEVGDVPVYGETRLPRVGEEVGEGKEKDGVKGTIREVSATSRLASSLSVHDRPRDRDDDAEADGPPPTSVGAD